jgi:hypothetical protein
VLLADGMEAVVVSCLLSLLFKARAARVALLAGGLEAAVTSYLLLLGQGAIGGAPGWKQWW